jgi:hypothetical protein
MNNHIGSRLTNDIRTLYDEDEGAKAFFDWAGARTNDAAETSVERISQVIELSYAEARELAKNLCELGCGEFVIGRKGWKSRIRWDVSLRSLGKAAGGENIEIEKVDPVLKEEAGEQVDSISVPEAAGTKGFTIREAKRRLAETLGIPAESIEITIKA